jgi:hypothetical protein
MLLAFPSDAERENEGYRISQQIENINFNIGEAGSVGETENGK